MIRSVKKEDAKSIAEIYNYYILNTVITFEEKIVDGTEFEKRIAANNNLPYLVYEQNNKVIGYAYATYWKARAAYKNTVEISIYLDNETRKKGIGTELYKELVKQLISLNFYVIIGGIALPNKASVNLHEKLGFEKVAHFKQTGFKFNTWVDVGYWQLLIEKNKTKIEAGLFK